MNTSYAFADYEEPVLPMGSVMVHLESGFLVEVIGFASFTKPDMLYLVRKIDDERVRDWASIEDLATLDRESMN